MKPSKLDTMFLEAIDEWSQQGRSAEQIHAVRNFFSGRGARFPQQIRDLVDELIGEDETHWIDNWGETRTVPTEWMNAQNDLKAELRAKVKEL